jgi:hypothetical protein
LRQRILLALGAVAAAGALAGPSQALAAWTAPVTVDST